MIPKNKVFNELWNPIESYLWEQINQEVAKPLLMEQLTSIFSRSSFYRKKFAGSLLNRALGLPDFKHLPFTEKHELVDDRSEEHTSELQSQFHLVCRLLLEKTKK